MKQHEVVLEKSTHTHVAKVTADKAPEVKNFENGEVIVKTNGTTVVEHAEHGMIALKKSFHKVNQQEFNPVSRRLQNAFD